MSRLKRIITVGTVALAAVVLAACSNQSSKNGESHQLSDKQVLNLSTTSEVTSMDISKAADSISLTQLYHTQEGLYRLGKKEKVENALATSTKVSSDGKTYTFTLRKNNKWNDGRPVTAKDFVYSWRRTVNPKTASSYAYLFDGVKNYGAIQKGTMNPDTLGIKAVGNDKLVVTLEKPVPYFKLLLAFPVFFPQEQSAVEKYGSKNGLSSETTAYDGPFTMKNWTGTNDNWKLAKNSNYWDKKGVHLNAINLEVVKDASTGLNLYQSGKLDSTPLSGTQIPSLKNNPDMKTYVGGSTVYLQFNQKKVDAFKNVKIRQALSLAINKESLAKNVLRNGSKAPLGFVSENFFQNPKTKTDFAKDAYVKDGVSYDLAKAKTLLKTGLKESGKSSLSFDLLTDNTDVDKTTAQYVQSQLQKLPNVKVNIVDTTYKTRLARSTSGDFDMVLSSWGADFADPINFLDLMQKGNSNNAGDFNDSTYNQLLDKAEGEDANNKDARYTDLVNAEKQLMNQQGLIPLYQPATVEMWNQHVKGYIWNPAGMSRDWKSIYITK
ncbi:peptide ABC transporter substrate-binding protein [Levilactobacillus bambusae]|uniref:Peptide ABC transporter substrate-binding protein n=1 Tax=Levilactobacillus bambusae TaxID=2024736 RepID=A0A2V1N3F8_9LACO|nr:peptide ABC transporter substrate-binding protein [Levilactobacillus bambusae]PWG00655.1 peptide ABC transporter substrate-binding protein [Levilactobacillus bambusae]